MIRKPLDQITGDDILALVETGTLEGKTLEFKEVLYTVVTPAFELPARWVIHTVGPVWRGGGYEEDAQLASCYQRTLSLEAEHGAQSISFPAISTDVYKFPPERAAKVAVREIRPRKDARILRIPLKASAWWCLWAALLTVPPWQAYPAQAAQPLRQTAEPRLAPTAYTTYRHHGSTAFLYPITFRIKAWASEIGVDTFAAVTSPDGRMTIRFMQSWNFIGPEDYLSFLITSGAYGEKPKIHRSHSDARSFSCAGLTRRG